MTRKENLAKESDRINDIVRQMNIFLIELQERIIGIDPKHRLKVVKGMTNHDLDAHIFTVWQMCAILTDYYAELRLELDKRAKFGFIPIDGSDWEEADNGRPSIGPRIELKEDESEFV